MSMERVIEALSLPTATRVDQRVPKKLLLEQGARTATDKRHIQDGIETLQWIAAIKPTNSGIPEFRDELREYLEIAVLTVVLRVEAKTTRLLELIHRAVPYPVVLLVGQQGHVALSLAHKRHSEAESGKVVIDDVLTTRDFRPDSPQPDEQAFLSSVSLVTQQSQNLFCLYESWVRRVETLAAAQITGEFIAPDSTATATAQREALADHERLTRELAGMRALAAKEKQLNRLVELNLEMKQLEGRLMVLWK